jgi:hypothetical protein
LFACDDIIYQLVLELIQKEMKVMELYHFGKTRRGDYQIHSMSLLFSIVDQSFELQSSSAMGGRVYHATLSSFICLSSTCGQYFLFVSLVNHQIFILF